MLAYNQSVLAFVGGKILAVSRKIEILIFEVAVLQI